MRGADAIIQANTDERPHHDTAIEGALWSGLPHSPEAERRLIESICAQPSILQDLLQFMKPDDFYIENARIVFEAVAHLSRDGAPIDEVTVTARLRELSKLDRVGGADAIRMAFNLHQDAGNWKAHADIVRSKSQLRRMHHLGADLVNGATAADADPQVLGERLQKAAIRLNVECSTEQRTFDARSLARDAVDRMQARFEDPAKLTGLGSGIQKLDFLMGGRRRKRLTVIGAPTKQGKSSLMRQMILHAVLEEKKPVALFTIEMSKEEVFDAMVATVAQVDSMKIDRTKLLSERDMDRVQSAIQRLSSAPLYIRDESSLTPVQFQAACRQMVAEYGIAEAWLDYLQITRPAGSSRRGEGNREQEVSEAAWTCKEVAKELDIHVGSITQLNKAGEARESQAVEMHCDTLIRIEHEDSSVPNNGSVDLNVRLNRGMPTGRVPCIWRAPYTYFEPNTAA